MSELDPLAVICFKLLEKIPYVQFAGSREKVMELISDGTWLVQSTGHISDTGEKAIDEKKELRDCELWLGCEIRQGRHMGLTLQSAWMARARLATERHHGIGG